ncbi:MAG: GTP 3',8-cyclase MoaA, partial [Phycisphaerales bacterium]|nr:GTP 3',8-cyclase MoaA [Phycisphaerales bacterium]
TDRCNFRCVYCMDPGVRFMAREALLTPAELLRLARICVGLGVEKIRITGGEPTLHPDLDSIIRGLRALGPIDLALTTNAARLTEADAARWKQLGLDRVTVSIDATDPVAFAAITRSNATPDRVIDGVRAAQRAGLGPIKLNAVIVRGQNEDQIVPLAGLARELGVEMRFIEFMPLDSSRSWDPSRLVPADEIVSRIAAAWALRDAGRADSSATALLHEFADGAPGRIGVIASVTRPFCGACSRLRITADAKVRPCLFSVVEHDLMALVRGGAGDRVIEDALVEATWSKQAGHAIAAPGFVQPDRSMSAIGG